MPLFFASLTLFSLAGILLDLSFTKTIKGKPIAITVYQGVDGLRPNRLLCRCDVGVCAFCGTNSYIKIEQKFYFLPFKEVRGKAECIKVA